MNTVKNGTIQWAILSGFAAVSLAEPTLPQWGKHKHLPWRAMFEVSVVK